MSCPSSHYSLFGEARTGDPLTESCTFYHRITLSTVYSESTLFNALNLEVDTGSDQIKPHLCLAPELTNV